MNRARWLPAALVLSVLTACPHAYAQDDKAAAEVLFDEAKKMMAAKRYGEACPKFADSQRLDPGVGTLLNLGLCYKQLGQTASAWSTYLEAASLARSAGQDDREELARQEAKALEPQLTKLVIEVPPDAARIDGLTIKRDGGDVPRGLWGVPAPVDPGKRTIDVTAPNKKPLHLEANAQGAGATSKVVIPVLEDGPPPVVANPPSVEPTPATLAPVAPQDPHPGKTQRIIGYVVGGAGILTGAVGTWFCLLSVAENKAADQTSNEAHKEQHRSDAQSARTVGFVGIGVGATAFIAGLVLVVTAPKAPATANLLVVPEFAEHEAGLSLRGRF